MDGRSVRAANIVARTHTHTHTNIKKIYIYIATRASGCRGHIKGIIVPPRPIIKLLKAIEHISSIAFTSRVVRDAPESKGCGGDGFLNGRDVAVYNASAERPSEIGFSFSPQRPRHRPFAAPDRRPTGTNSITPRVQ